MSAVLMPHPQWIADARARLVAGIDPAGQPLVSLLVKRAYRFDFGHGLIETAPASPWVEAPVVEALPDRPGALLRHDSELFAYKRHTDVIVEGHVVADQPTRELTVTVSAGPRCKNILVVGDRTIERGRIREPEPFMRMPLCWTRAYGGIDPSVDVSLAPDLLPGAYPRNPVGTGWAHCASPRDLDGLSLPNFEHPRRRIVSPYNAHWRDAPAPQGLGWVHPSWFPRALDPTGAQLRANNGAAFTTRLGFGDAIELIGFAGEGTLRLPVPAFPQATMLLERKRLDVEVALHTAHVDLDARVLTLVWAARARTPRPAPFEHLTAALEGQLVPIPAEAL